MFPMFAAWEMVPKGVKTFLTKSVLILIAVAAIYFGIKLTISYIDTQGYNRGVAETEKKYANMADTEKTKTIVQERTIKQFISKKTDADLRQLLDFWMQPAPEGTDTSR